MYTFRLPKQYSRTSPGRSSQYSVSSTQLALRGLGVRNAPEEGHVPGSIRGAYINAFHEIVDIHHGEKLYGFPETKQTIANGRYLLGMKAPEKM